MTRLLEVVRLRHALRVLIFRLTRGMLTSASKSYRLFEASLRLHQYKQASLIAETARLVRCLKPLFCWIAVFPLRIIGRWIVSSFAPDHAPVTFVKAMRSFVLSRSVLISISAGALMRSSQRPI